jgi:hypothetical protein
LFEREHNIRIAAVLQALDAKSLAEQQCFFGGGTAIVLSHSEYRESLDLDFLVSDMAGYRRLRQGITEQGLRAITRADAKLNQVREIRADQYGIRTMLKVAAAEIKFEIVFEGRITLELPRSRDRICGVGCLTELDMATTKLLANSDRWMDDSTFSRDLIDLAMLNPSRRQLTKAIEKASAPYGETIERDLGRAIERLKNRPGRLDECMESLKMKSVPKAVLWKQIRKLVTRKSTTHVSI